MKIRSGSKPRPCPHCGKETRLHKYDPEEYQRRKVENAKRSAERAKLSGASGRRRKVNYTEVVKLREHGFSQGQIAMRLNCSRGTVCYALRLHQISSNGC